MHNKNYNNYQPCQLEKWRISSWRTTTCPHCFTARAGPQETLSWWRQSRQTCSCNCKPFFYHWTSSCFLLIIFSGKISPFHGWRWTTSRCRTLCGSLLSIWWTGLVCSIEINSSYKILRKHFFNFLLKLFRSQQLWREAGSPERWLLKR